MIFLRIQHQCCWILRWVIGKANVSYYSVSKTLLIQVEFPNQDVNNEIANHAYVDGLNADNLIIIE